MRCVFKMKVILILLLFLFIKSENNELIDEEIASLDELIRLQVKYKLSYFKITSFLFFLFTLSRTLLLANEVKSSKIKKKF